MTLQDDDRTIHEGAAVGAVEPRGQIAVAGKDRASYLQGLLTNDIQALTPGSGCYAAWLTPQGRMLTDMHVLQSETMILLDVPAAQMEPTLQRLDQFLFSEAVQLGSLAQELSTVWVHGPGAAAALGRAVQGVDRLAEWAQYQHAQAAFAGATVVVARIAQLGVPGFCIFLEPTKQSALVDALHSAGAAVVSPEAIDLARIENGYPLFGVDMTEDTIPLEAEIQDRAISLTKGCYVGQEIIIRVLHRGGGRVAKRLVRLTIDGTAPSRGARIVSGEREVGAITSAGISPRLGAIALGYVHRDFVLPGTTLEIESSTGRVSAMISSRALPSAV